MDLNLSPNFQSLKNRLQAFNPFKHTKWIKNESKVSEELPIDKPEEESDKDETEYIVEECEMQLSEDMFQYSPKGQDESKESSHLPSSIKPQSSPDTGISLKAQIYDRSDPPDVEAAKKQQIIDYLLKGSKKPTKQKSKNRREDTSRNRMNSAHSNYTGASKQKV